MFSVHFEYASAIFSSDQWCAVMTHKHYDFLTTFVELTVSGDCNPGAGQFTGAEGDLPHPRLNVGFLMKCFIVLQASLELEIDSLVEQSTDLHSLYARQDELLKRLTSHSHIQYMICSYHAYMIVSGYLVVNTVLWRRTSLRNLWTSTKRCGTESLRQTSSGSKPS